ncbi:lysis system i-spanin subunit Rz [Pseudomonas sp. URIL14HWK12:I5]|uniref:lysis system i-spanin subunit Rz n=1 Tax=Pseudomonas sp. URIL14HWK12:I5 TaxID=1261630 RepID=UPI0009D79F6D|nr:lysis system i-spanin subunit Rz [Pseudomonas sp. URIL14HWK12:I5]SMD00572.1 prophage endopeptidase [Pseudomonas sp. URIL14HWK12:I5]
MTFDSVRSVLTLLLMAVLSWAVWEYKDQLVTVRAERDAALEEAYGLRIAATITAARLATAAANDAKHTQELRNARKKNEDLRLSVGSGDQRLFVQAICPVASVPASSGAAGMADGTTAELAPNARPDYFTLLDQLALSEQMILGLQDHIDTVCPKPTTTTGTAP